MNREGGVDTEPLNREEVIKVTAFHLFGIWFQQEWLKLSWTQGLLVSCFVCQCKVCVFACMLMHKHACILQAPAVFSLMMLWIQTGVARWPQDWDNVIFLIEFSTFILIPEHQLVRLLHAISQITVAALIFLDDLPPLTLIVLNNCHVLGYAWIIKDLIQTC